MTRNGMRHPWRRNTPGSYVVMTLLTAVIFAMTSMTGAYATPGKSNGHNKPSHKGSHGLSDHPKAHKHGQDGPGKVNRRSNSDDGTGELTSSHDQVCKGLDSGKIDVSGNMSSITVAAPDGQLIDGYCVKAGSVQNGNGPSYHEVNPPQKTITITYPSGKDISHYSVSYADASSPDDQCPDGTKPSDVNGDGDENADDCTVIGPPPSSNPLGSLTVNCKGMVTVKLDNRKSTIELDYYLERTMAPTAAQAERFTVEAGNVRTVTRRGNPGDVFALGTDSTKLGSVTVPVKCRTAPPNASPPSSLVMPVDRSNHDVPAAVNAGLAPTAIHAMAQTVGVKVWLSMAAGLIGIALIGAAIMKRHTG